MSPITVRFDPPSHGWLTLYVGVGERTFCIDAADMPNNPVQALVDALDLAASHKASSVWWNLEPGSYWMEFVPQGERVAFRLRYAKQGDATKATTQATLLGSRDEVILPFWRFLQAFQTARFAEPDWPDVHFERMACIGEWLEGAAKC